MIATRTPSISKKNLRFTVVRFPGSNCDFDCAWLVEHRLNQPLAWAWHEDKKLPPTDVLLVPGGFSYGDYLRAGAIAATSPVCEAIVRHAEKGGLVMGICNGFQILTEIGLLPGALQQNSGLRFACQWVHLRVENNTGPFLSHLPVGTVLRLPIAHAEGNYTPPAKGPRPVAALLYCDENGVVSEASNPNGSVGNIAGLLNQQGNVLGLMPHPERAADPQLGGTDGLALFSALGLPPRA